jgi:phosphonate transport system permease protein
VLAETVPLASQARARRPRWGLLLGIAGMVGAAVWSATSLEIRPARLSGVGNLLVLLAEAVPPDLSLAALAFRAIIETLQIAFLGTVAGAALALPLGVLGARNLYGPLVTIPARIGLAAIRTLPALLWAVVFVVAVGLGPLAGVLASAFYTVGYLGKLHYEAIEGLDPAPLHAVLAAGASRLQAIRHVVLPESANQILSQLLFMFEYNVRASSVFGFVGAGGIGFYISGYLTVFRYQSVLTLLIAVFITVMVLDYVSVRVRDRFLVPATIRPGRRRADRVADP